jgi:hypothetical protein
MSAYNVQTITFDSFSGTSLSGTALSDRQPSTYFVVYSANTSPLQAMRSSTPVSYTFTSSADQYQKIFSAQCSRVGSIINENLHQLDRSDDDYNETLVDQIAKLIDLLGEPAFLTAAMEAGCATDDAFALEPLLLAIASSTHKETENLRLELVKKYAERPDFKTKRAAVRALGRFKSANAKELLREISAKSGRSEIAQMANSLAR